MKRVIDTGLPPLTIPVSWATVGNGLLFTVHVPLDDRGVVVEGDIRVQTAQCLRNLARSVAAAGARMDDVTQVVVFLTDPADVAGMNEVYAQHFRPPYPSRATVIVAALVVPGIRVEMLAYAAIGRRRVTASRRARDGGSRRRSSAAGRGRAARRASR